MISSPIAGMKKRNTSNRVSFVHDRVSISNLIKLNLNPRGKTIKVNNNKSRRDSPQSAKDGVTEKASFRRTKISLIMDSSVKRYRL
jgi:hypothetical protein